MQISVNGTEFDISSVESYGHIALSYIAGFIPKLLGAIIVIYIGFKFANFIGRLLHKFFEKKDFDPTIEIFIENLTKVILKVLVVLTGIGILGVQTSSFIALLAAAGFAIGSALGGSLSNFASGILILLFKPYKIGDLVEISGITGTVSDINIFSTQMTTVDTRIVVIPNSNAIGDKVINYSKVEFRKQDIMIGISYSDSIDRAKEILENIAKSDSRIIINEEYPLQIIVHSLGDNAVNIAFRPWTRSEDYWKLKYDLIETIKKEFDTGGIHFPFPQRDVHLYTMKS